MSSRLQSVQSCVATVPAELLEKRAVQAYLRSGGTDQPDSGRTEIDENTLTLANVNGPLATYRLIRTQRGVRLRRQLCVLM